MKLLIWTPIPTHHQAALFAALRSEGCDLRVHYFERVPDSRRRMGWVAPDELQSGEFYERPSFRSLFRCSDWRERTHVISGFSHPFFLLLAALLSIASVPWAHRSEPSRRDVGRSFLKRSFRGLYVALVNRHACAALAMGELARRDFLISGIDPQLIRIVPYSIPSVPKHESARPPNDIRFGFIGALCERKGIDVLLRAFASVRAQTRVASLRLIGSDESNGEYQTLSRLLNLPEVQFGGSVPAAQIGSVLAECDVLILPSRFDGWGMVLAEAASVGKALIASDACGAAYHVIEDGRAGFIVPAGDHHSLADRMLKYCNEPELIELHGSRCRELFSALVPERVAGQMIRALA